MNSFLLLSILESYFFLICWWKELALCCLQYTKKLGSIYVGLYIDKNILLIYPRTSQTDKATYFGASFKQYHFKIIHTDSGSQLIKKNKDDKLVTSLFLKAILD